MTANLTYNNSTTTINNNFAISYNHRDIFEYLKLKAGPSAKRITELHELDMVLRQLADESLADTGVFTVALGLFDSSNRQVSYCPCYNYCFLPDIPD